MYSIILQRFTLSRLVQLLSSLRNRCGCSRVLWMLASGTAVGLIGAMAPRTIVMNTSPSVPPGLYVKSWQKPCVGGIVDFKIPVRLQPYIQLRTGRTGLDWYLLKPIVAGPGDQIDTTSGLLKINGQTIAPIATHDADGRLLPVWSQNGV